MPRAQPNMSQASSQRTNSQQFFKNTQNSQVRNHGNERDPLSFVPGPSRVSFKDISQGFSQNLLTQGPLSQAFLSQQGFSQMGLSQAEFSQVSRFLP